MDNFKYIPFKAHCEVLEGVSEETSPDLWQLEPQIRQAANENYYYPASLVRDGKPYILRFSGWLAHANFNINGDGFLAEDLEAAVAQGIATPPNILMMDFGHDFSAYGAWWKSEYAFDDEAQVYGIKVEGTVWAWRYDVLASTVLAMQERLGYVPMSMSCLPVEVIPVTATTRLLRYPVFFTSSLLQVKQADPHGTAKVVEDLELVEASNNTKEESMDEKMLEALRQLLAEAKDEAGIAAVTAKLDEFAEAMSRLPQVEGELETLRQAHEEMGAVKTQLEATVEELTGQKGVLEVALETVKAELGTVQAELETLRSEKAEREAAQAAATAESMFQARLARLSETAREAIEAKEEEAKQAILNTFRAMDETTFETVLEAYNLVGKDSLVDRSNREGLLNGGTPQTRKYNIDKFLK